MLYDCNLFAIAFSASVWRGSKGVSTEQLEDRCLPHANWTRRLLGWAKYVDIYLTYDLTLVHEKKDIGAV